MAERPLVVLVVRAIIRQNDRVLMLQRSSEDSWDPGKWEFPGGKVDHSQRLDEAIEREIEEEISCQVEMRQPIHFYDKWLGEDSPKYPNHLYLALVFECWLVRGQIVTRDALSFEHQDFKWVTLEETLKLPMSPITREFLQRFFERR